MKSLDIIAEIGSVHDGSLGNALKLIELASDCGATTVKFQTHIAQAETLRNAPSPYYFNAETRYDYFVRTSFSPKQWELIAKKSKDCGIRFLSSPFSLEAVDLLESVGISAYKIPSGEVSNIPLLEYVAATGKPVVLSSGMSNWLELDRAVRIFQKRVELTVMQCSSIYPCSPNQVGLNVITQMQERYKTKVGLSDHTLGITAPIVAVGIGAEAIEKHLTFSRKMYGSDAPHSLEPAEFKQMVNCLKEAFTMINSSVDKDDLSNYLDMKKIFEKSIVTSMPVKKGSEITREMLTFKKPGDGIPASEYMNILGRKVALDLPSEHKIMESDLLE